MPDLSAHPHLAKLIAWAEDHPRIVFGVLRFIDPILDVKNLVVVTRFDDVQEVLARDQIFHVTYQAKMEKVTGGENFFLGMQDSPRYTRDVSNMRLAVRREDLPNIVLPQVDAAIARCINDIAGKGRCDIIQELTRIVPADLVGSYFGTPGWDRKEFTDDLGTLFAYLFFPDNPDAESASLAAAARCRDYLDQCIAARKQARGQHDDVLERCLQMQDTGLPGCSDLDIRNNLIGLLIGAVPTTSKAAALCVDYLLDHPELLLQAQQAAGANDDAQLNQFVLESLRFNPFGPGVFRLCAQDYILGQGTLRAQTIPAGKMVLALTQAAMLDGDKVTDPGDFKLDRPGYIYMHYGYGLHTCFGQYINSVQIARIVKAIIQLPNVRRAEGEEGKLQIVDQFPAHMVLEYAPF